MKKINGLVKKLKICGIMLGCSILLSGCGLNDVFDHVDTTVQERIDQNIALLTKLKLSGLLSESDYSTLENNLRHNVAKLQKQIEENTTTVPGQLKSAGRWIIPEGGVDPRQAMAYIHIDDDDSKGYVNPVLFEFMQNYKGSKGITSIIKTSDNPAPYSILSEKDQKLFTDIMGIHIYVLNSDTDIGKDIANISAACNKIKNKTFTDDADKANCYSVLNKYFKDSGETLLESGDKIIANSVDNTTENRAKFGLSGSGAMDPVLEKYAGNGIGVDLALVSSGYATVTFRISELNPLVINKIVGSSAFTNDKYLVQKTSDSGQSYNAIYLMEYPISYIESIEYDKGDNKATVEVKASEAIKVNIMSGEVINIHGNDALDATTKAAMEKLLNVNPSTSAGQSSFILWNKAENLILPDGTYKDSSGTVVSRDDIGVGPTGHMMYGINDVTEQGKKAETNTILLRDYLELNYMPGVVSEQERFVTLGRRLRINDLNTDGTVKDIEKPFANFVDKNGVIVEGGSVMITDLIDTSSGNKDNEKKSIKLAVYDDVGEKDLAGATSDTGFTLDAIENTFEKVEYKDKISVTMQFPVEDSLNDNHIAIDDASYNFGSESRGIYYGMATDVNVFSSNLYSGWINISNAESGGIKWWNSWLENNKYSYRINEENLLAYLGLNFTAQMAKEGENYIVFNEETVKKLNEDIRQKERVDKATGVRTAFVLMGFLIIMYALVFISAWVVDTATANSIGMLKAITGGHCVAVQDDMDIPSVDASSTKYITFGSALIRGILIIAIGILLIKTDILGLAGSIFNAFKGIGTELFNRLFNI